MSNITQRNAAIAATRDRPSRTANQPETSQQDGVVEALAAL